MRFLLIYNKDISICEEQTWRYNMKTTERLLAQYNKKERQPITTTADGDNRISITSSYANMYDALYDRFSTNKNFNTNMFQESIRLGEQDQYFAFLEANKDKNLSVQFYDPEYYNYESMMLELSLPFLDNTEVTTVERFTQVFDALSNSWIDESLGEMSDQQYVQYQIAQATQLREQEIQKRLELIQKENLGTAAQLGHSLLARRAEFGEGILAGLAGTADFIVAVGTLGLVPWAMYEGEGNYADAFVEYFGQNGLLAAEKNSVRKALDEYERKYTIFRDINGNITTAGKWIGGIANSIGMMVPAIITTAVTGGAAAPVWLGNLTFYSSIFSSNMYENATNEQIKDTPALLKIGNAAVKTGVEAVAEYALGKIMGGTIQNRLLGVGGKVKVAEITKKNAWKYMLKSAGQEGLEEFVQDFSTNCVDQFTAMLNEGWKGYGDTGVTVQTLIDSLAMGFVSSLVMSGGQIAMSGAKSRLQNLKAPGSGDLLIETENGKIEKLTGSRKLYYSSILSDFKSAVDKLKKGKFSTKNNIELAQEVYAAMSTMTQFYSSFDADRIKNCEALLARVVKAENDTKQRLFAETNERASTILSPETINDIDVDRNGRKQIRLDTKQRAQELGTKIDNIFQDMISDLSIRHVSQKTVDELRKKIKNSKVLDRLEKDGVTDVDGVINKGVRYKKDKEITAIVEEYFGGNRTAESLLDELSAQYDWVFVTDGYGAREVDLDADKVIFVPKSWLQNYTESEIYSYLAQNKILETIIARDQYKPMIDKLIEIDKKFTKRENIDAEQALMDFLFNESVYQYFMLSTIGKGDVNGRAFKDFIYNIHDVIKDLGKEANNQFKKESPAAAKKFARKRSGQLNKIYKMIKDTMRKPTIKAILGWGFEPQDIGADNILTDTDIAYIRAYKEHRNVFIEAVKTGNITSAYRELTKPVIENGNFTDTEKSIIDKGLADNASREERLLACTLLDVADMQIRSDNSFVGSLILPYSAVNMAKQNNIADTQYVNDALGQFRKSYGISAQDMFRGNLSGMSIEQMNKYDREAGLLGVRNNPASFVIYKLEGLLGNDFIVTPKYEHIDEKLSVSVTNFIDFNIVRKIPADIFFDKTLLSKSLEERQEIFERMFHSSTISTNVFTTIGERELFAFLSSSNFSEETKDKLKDVKVIFTSGLGTPGATNTSGTIIAVDISSEDYFDTLVHELNHVLQIKLDMPYGFHEDLAYNMPDFLAEIANEYAPLVEYYCRITGNVNPMNSISSRVNSEDILRLSKDERKTLAYCAYLLVQGEVWARSYIHNKNVHGFTNVKLNDGDYIVSPDTKRRYKIVRTVPDDTKVSEFQAQSVTPELAGAAIAADFKRRIEARARIERRGYMAQDDRNTYHSSLTKVSNYDVMRKIVSPTMSVFDRIQANIDKVIKDPMRYLPKEILQTLNGDYSEGNTYHRLREYIEQNFDGISIDRKSDTHAYTLVDDNAYDDLLLPSMLAKSNSDKATLFNKFKGKERIFLNQFYKQFGLKGLGINPTAYVVLSPDVTTETVIDAEHRSGAIFIKCDENTSDAEIIHKLNHEFRHLLQYYNGFETGFTPNFKVSKELLADVKTHVPGIFKDPALQNWAKALAKNSGDTWENELTKQFIYFMNGGEANAYMFSSLGISTKDIYVTEEAGNPVIFLPWYDGKTGEGRHKTEFIAMRADDDKLPDPVYLTLPREKITHKYKSKKKTEIQTESGDTKTKVKYDYGDQYNNRHFSKEDAGNTNLKYFIKRGKQNQLASELQEFVKATTGKLEALPGKLRKYITTGTLNYQVLYEWFRKTDLKKLNRTTFNLLNKYIFKNDYITSPEMLSKITEIDIVYYWAAISVLQETMLLENNILNKTLDVETLNSFLNRIKNTKLEDKIAKRAEQFGQHWFKSADNEFGLTGMHEYLPDVETSGYVRVLAMQHFTGSLSSVWYVGNTYRKILRDLVLDQYRGGKESLDKEIDDANSTNKSTTVGETIGVNDEYTFLDTDEDIQAAYLTELDNRGRIQLQKDVIYAYTQNLAMEKGLDPNNFTQDEYKKYLSKDITEFLGKLAYMNDEELKERWLAIKSAQVTGTKGDAAAVNTDMRKSYSKLRSNIVRRIKDYGNTIINLIESGEITLEELDPEIQQMFTTDKFTNKNGKSIERLIVNPDVYSVGKGRKKLKGETDTRRANYAKKHNVLEGTEDFRHDTSEIYSNADKLREAKLTLVEKVKQAKKERDEYTKTQQRASDSLLKLLKESTVPPDKVLPQKTEITVKQKKEKRSKISDTPNYITISSGVEMPEVLFKIFDVSFTEMADTRVQFASRDVDTGKVYEKTDTEFNSRLKHEVKNWDAFYEAARGYLVELTASDVKDIVEFFTHGVRTDGFSDKISAFEIFILGYIVDAARRNLNAWNFSKQEVELLENLYEQRASYFGSGLNAVRQMLDVVNPVKKIRQRYFDDYDVTETELTPLLQAVDDLQTETNDNELVNKTKKVIDEMQAMEKLLAERGLKEKPAKFSRWYNKIKSGRFLAMLSSPLTWVRNIVSNATLTGLNKASDTLGRLIWPKKGYRENQWDLHKTEISTDVKNFIDKYIKNNELFEKLYETTTKYENRKKSNQRTLFIDMVVAAFEKEYAANHRFDKKVTNMISQFISNRLSDKRFIKFVTGNYFGKMLTIEVEKGDVDLSKGLTNDVLDLFARAVMLGNIEYMHKRSFFADSIDSMRRAHPVAYEVLTIWQPFLNSSFNWFQECLKYSPIGLANAIYRAATLEKQITRVNEMQEKGMYVADSRMVQFLTKRDIGKGIIGTTLFGLGILLAMTGVMKLEEDDSEDKFYFVVGDVKVDISNVFGTSSLFVGASIAQTWLKDENSDNMMTLTEGFGLAADYLFNGFILNDILERHKYDNNFFEVLMTETDSTLRSFTPQLVQLIAKMFNNEQIKYSSGLKGVWERYINSWIPTQPMGSRRVNPYTGEVESKYSIPASIGELLKGGVLGPNIYFVNISSTELLARDYGVNKNMLTGEITVDGKKKSLDIEALNTKYGQLNADSLAKIKSQKHRVEVPDGTYKTLSWDKLSDEQRTRVINRTMNQNAEIAKIYIWTQMGHKYYADNSLWEELKRLGVTRNVYKGDKGFVE